MDEIIEGLKESLQAELYSSAFCWRAAHNLTGITSYQLYYKYFEKCYKDELKHFDLISDHLQGYLEELEYPSITLTKCDTIEDILEHLLNIEIESVERYTRLANIASKEGNVAMNNLFANLALDEEEDRKKIVKLLGHN